MTIEASLTCDGCAHIILAASNAILARRELLAHGGKITRDGDFCQQCVAKGYADPDDPRRLALRPPGTRP